jgi:hypothetical protein
MPKAHILAVAGILAFEVTDQEPSIPFAKKNDRHTPKNQGASDKSLPVELNIAKEKPRENRNEKRIRNLDQ